MNCKKRIDEMKMFVQNKILLILKTIIQNIDEQIDKYVERYINRQKDI